MDFKPEKKLGFGLMRLPLRNPEVETDIDIYRMKQMVDLFLEQGFTYFDTAWMYHGFASESAVKEALSSRVPRDRYTLATKLHAEYIETEEDRDKVFFAQLEKTGVEFFDYYLIHDIENVYLEKIERLHVFDWLLEKKKQGLVRHAGFSFHDTPELLDQILTAHPEMEFVQLQINYLDWENPKVQSRACYETAVRHGKQVVVMEPVKGGTLVKVPEAVKESFLAKDSSMSMASWAIRFAASLPNVMVVLSGMSSLEQMKDNTGYMKDFIPLKEEEKELCLQAAEVIRTAVRVPCTGCSYCTEGCPMNIAIPRYFELYNRDYTASALQADRVISRDEYRELTSKFGRPSECIGCAQCERVCPQSLPVIRTLKEVVEYYGE